MNTPAWRESVLDDLKTDNYPLISTAYFRELCYARSLEEKGSPIKQRMADSYLKQLTDDGVLQSASKGVFINEKSATRPYISDAVANVMRSWGRGQQVILSGPWSIAGEIPEQGPLIVHTDARFSTLQVGLFGYDKEDARGQCYVISSNPQMFESFESLQSENRVVRTSDGLVSYEVASPEKALMLMAVQTSGQTRLDFIGAVNVLSVGDRIELEVTNPLTGEAFVGSVDPEVLNTYMSMEASKSDSPKKGKDYTSRVELLTQGNSGGSILEALDKWSVNNPSGGGIYSFDDADIVNDGLEPLSDGMARR